MKRICALIAMLAATAHVAADDTVSTGTTTAQPTILILRNKNDLPGGSNSKLTLDASSYVGYTQSFANSFAEFLASIEAIIDPNAIVGIDSQNTSARTISYTIDLSTLNGVRQEIPYYLGTTSLITITGSIIPTRPPAGEPSTLYFTALNGGYLNIATRIGTVAAPADAVVIGQPSDIRVTDGTVELSGNNTYTGGTRILGGTLQINAGNNLGTGLVTVSAGATLNLGTSGTVIPRVSLEPGSTISGNGTFDKLVTIGSGVNLVPGSIGKIAEMHFHGGVLFTSGAIWHIDISTTNADTLCVWDNIIIEGDKLTPITINLYSINATGVEGALSGFDPKKSYTWTIAYRPNNQVVVTGFDPAYFTINAEQFFKQNPSLQGLGDFNIEQINNALAITFTPVPEPSTYALMALGLAALALRKFRRRD